MDNKTVLTRDDIERIAMSVYVKERFTKDDEVWHNLHWLTAFARAVETDLGARIQPAASEAEKRVAELEAARMAYASEFPPNAEGELDVGNIHSNIRLLKARIAELSKALGAIDASEAGAVPVEHKALPIEPTSELLRALSGEWHSSRWDKTRRDYAALMNAAPPAPSQQAAPAAESAEPANPDKCNADVFTHGVSMGVFGMTKQQAEAYCKAETARTGRLHDWHYVAGRVHVKALIAQPTAATADAQGNIAASVSDKAGCISHSAGSDKQADAQGDERAAFKAIAAKHWQNSSPPDNAWLGFRLGAAWARQPSAAASAELTPAARDVLAERQRQISVEGWHAAEDDNHEDGQMAAAAACYAMFTQAYPPGDPVQYWPWDKSWWKPSTPRRNLVKAGALILAEIERLDRAALAAAKPEGGAA